MEFYYTPPSPPCRSVMLLLKALSLEPEMKIINLLEREQYAEEFVELNPQHSVPVLVDDGFAVIESRAILMYLAETYGQDSAIYPQDIKIRSVINQRLFFDMGTLSSRIGQCYLIPVIWQNSLPNEELKEKVNEAFNMLSIFLENNDWVAGENMTIADFALVSTVSTAEGLGVDISQYPNVSEWLLRCKENMEDYEELNQNGLNMLIDIYNEKLDKLNE